MNLAGNKNLLLKICCKVVIFYIDCSYIPRFLYIISLFPPPPLIPSLPHFSLRSFISFPSPIDTVNS